MLKDKIKKRIKQTISKYPSYNSEDIIRRIQPFDYVSFDIFDTLVKRTVSEPEDVFDLVAQKYSKNNGYSETMREFHRDRKLAEQSAKHSSAKSGREDTNLSEIYENFPGSYSKSIREVLYSLEIAAEKECCHANPVIYRVYQWCKEHHKHIIITSDMYLPLECIKDILNRCGYDEYEELFLSSDIGLTKSSGNLYSHILFNLQMAPRDLVHIGDNIRGDYIRAKEKRINAILIARDPHRTRFIRLHSISKKERKMMAPIAKAINGLVDTKWDEYYQFGFEVIGPLLYGFTLWLHNTALADSVEKLYFVSRDGYLMQKAYQYIYGESAIENRYLYASRRALISPQIWIYPTFEDVVKLLPNYKQSTCESICDVLGIDTTMGLNLWQESGLDIKESLIKKDMVENISFMRFYEAAKESIIKNSKREFDLFIHYLEQNYFKGNIAIVDIGWNGNLQKCLNAITSAAYNANELNLQGYYLGLSQSAKTELRAKAYIQRSSPQLGCAGLIELCFPSCEGSTHSYKNLEGNIITPVLYPYEYAGKFEMAVTTSIQSGAMAFLGFFKDYGASSIERDFGWRSFEAILTQPTKNEIRMFGKLEFLDTSLRRLAHPESLIHYIAHPKQAYMDLLNSGWGIAFLKKLLLVPAPYASILRFFKRIGK